MAVAMSLLIILPALAENTNGEVTQGRGTTGELIVGVYDSNDIAGVRDPADVATGAPLRTIPGANNTAAEAAAFRVDTAEDTFSGTKLYVSNRHDAMEEAGSVEGGYNTVLVTQLGAEGAGCLTVKVRNTRSKATITLALVPSSTTETVDTVQSRYFQNYFRVADADFESTDPGAIDLVNSDGRFECDDGTLTEVDTDSDYTNGVQSRAPADILARDGDVLTITADTWVQELHVDGAGPEFSSITPAHNTIQDSSRLRIAFTVRDDGSGIRHDGEFIDMPDTDTDPERSNLDDDQAYESEPLSDVDGASEDIAVLIAPALPGIRDYHGETAPAQTHAQDPLDQSAHGNGDWDMIEQGTAYRLALSYNATQSGEFKWQLVAVDRVGNTSYSDADVNKENHQPYLLTIDNAPPIIVTGRTGITYDDRTGKDTEIKDRSFIALTFQNDGTFGSPDLIDPASIDPSRFLLEADADAEPITVVGSVHSTDKTGKGLDAEDIIPPSRVYLELNRELGSDETPVIQALSGAVSDLAGNTNAPSLTTPQDRIEPGFAVTITADVNGRPVIGDDGEFEVTITSDEELLRSPTIYVASIKVIGATGSEKTAIKNVKSSSVASDGVNAWSQTLDDGDLPDGGPDGLYALIVTGEDIIRNVGSTAGRSGSGAPVGDDELDLAKLDSLVLLVEKDTALGKAGVEVTPNLGKVDVIETESPNPFVKLSFSAEGSEIMIDDSTSATVDKTKIAAKGTKVKFDSHASVTLGVVTLNGEAVDASQIRTLGSNEFLVQLSGLDIAKHELKYTATDELGNSASDTVKFEIKPRPAYKVALRPGWNLISLPGTPADPAIGSVVSDDLSVRLVLGYQNGAWLTAIRDSGGWSGTLTEIGGGWGYWIQSTAFETISALIPDVDTSSNLPTIPVTQGWNLLGVMDIQQGGAGNAPIGKAEADDYFTSIPWRVAYSFDARTSAWTKLVPEAGVVEADGGDDSDEILNAKGYWVWSSTVGTLVP